MWKYTLFVLLWIGYVPIAAQTLTLLDHATHKPVGWATLYSEKPAAQAMTDAEGKADVKAFEGAAAIEIRLLGYKSKTLSYAQVVESKFVVYLESVNFKLDEVVVSGTRWRQLSSKVPMKIIQVSEREIALQNPQTAADLLGISGKVFVQKSQQGGGSPMIRGFATNRLLYVVDGVRMNTAIFRGGNLQNVINLDPFAISGTEVLFGPGSVIYGSDAIGGVMSFQTLQPQLGSADNLKVSGKAVLRHSTANREKTGHVDLNVGGEKWAAVSSVSYWDYDHLRQGAHGPEEYLKSIHVHREGQEDRIISQKDPLLQVPSGYSQLNAMQKIRFKPGANWDLQYNFHFSETSPYGRYDRHNRLRNGLPRYAEWDYGPQRWMMNHLQVNHQDSNDLYDQVTLRVARQDFEESRIDRTLNKSQRNTQTEKVVAYSINLDFTKAINHRHKWYYGVDYVWNGVQSEGILEDITSNDIVQGPARYPQSGWTSVAAYITDEYQLGDKVSLQSGLRYSYYSLKADFSNNLPYYPLPFADAEMQHGALTGSAGLIYRPADSWILSTNLGTAFRSPNVDDIGKIFDSEPGAVTVPNPTLGPEYAWNLDLGIAKIFSDRFKIDLTGFYTRLDHAFVRRDFSLNGENTLLYDGVPSRVQAIQNAAVATIYGLQAGFEWALHRHLRFSSDLNLQVGEEELDDGSVSPTRHAAPTYGISRLNYRRHKLDIQLYAVYQAGRTFDQLPEEEKAKDEIYAKDAAGNNYAPSWYTLNIKAMYTLNPVLTLNAGWENLTDRRYRPYSSGISGAGKNLVVSLTARW